MIGQVHSLQTLGTVDGPGVRTVVFMQGCPLRCACCHNPDTWETGGGRECTAEELLQKVLRYKEYFKESGGITLSGGEPLLQAEFTCKVFSLCKENGIHTCLDTSGCILNDAVRALLAQTDLVLLDIKYTDPALYKKHVGCELQSVLDFLAYLASHNIPTWLRQVIIPSVNDSEENILRLKELAARHPNVQKIELLPFRKICASKYEEMQIKFPFGERPEADKALMEKLNHILRS